MNVLCIIIAIYAKKMSEVDLNVGLIILQIPYICYDSNF